MVLEVAYTAVPRGGKEVYKLSEGSERMGKCHLKFSPLVDFVWNIAELLILRKENSTSLWLF